MEQDAQKWKLRVQQLLQNCQDELKKTTEIGKKMLSASKANTTLKNSYEELGMLAEKAINIGEIDWNSSQVQEILGKIKDAKESLEHIEDEVQQIKFAAGNTEGCEQADDSDSKH
jgi:hypothetical protein